MKKDRNIGVMDKRVKISFGILGLALTAGLFSPALASIIDRPFFRANALVVVIGSTEDEANGGVAPVVVDFALLDESVSGSEAVDLIGLDGFVFNANSGFDAGHDFSGGASRIDINDEVSAAATLISLRRLTGLPPLSSMRIQT